MRWTVLLGLVVAGVTMSVVNPSVARGQASEASGTPGLTIIEDRGDRLIGSLPNGLIVIAQEMRAAPVVSAQVWVKTGSIYEQEHIGAGLSHFLEHLLSGGSTSTRTEDENNRILGQIGAQVNAATGLDTVHYYINTTRPYTRQAVELLSDWMRNSLITQAEYERERSVIQREFEMGEGDPGRIFWKLTQAARYREHPARHPTIGYLPDFLSITRDGIHDFYRRMYVPNNMVFVVAGDIDRHAVARQVAQLWHDAKPGTLPVIALPDEPAIDSPRSAQGYADIRSPRLRLAWPGTRLGAEGDYALDLMAVVLGQGESSRLVRTVRQEQGLVNTIDAYNLSFPWGPGFVGIDAEVKVPAPTTPDADPQALAQAAIERARTVILEQVRRMVEEGVTDQELARAKRQTLLHVVLDAQTVGGMARRLAGDVISKGDPDYLRRYAAAIEAITAGQVRDAAKKFLDAQRLIELTLLPRPQDMPPQKLVRPAGDPEAAAFAVEKVNLDNGPLLERLRASLTSAQAVKAPAAQEPVRRVVLSNGLRLLVQRNTTVPAVAMQMYWLGGLLADEPGREGLANATASMLVKGTRTRSAETIAREIEDLGAALSTSGGSNTSYASGVCLSGDWRRLMDMLADVTLNPVFPDEEWTRMQSLLLAGIARQSDSWSGELRVNFTATYFKGHPWAVSRLGRAEAVREFTAGDLRRFHASRLGASDAVLAVFGDVDVEQVVAEATKLFAAMPVRPEVAFAPATPAAREGGVYQFATRKPLAAVLVGLGPGITRMSPDFAAVEVLSNVLSSFPAGWLEQELRGRGPGLVYAVGAGQVTGLVPGYFNVVFNTEPAKVSEALGRALSQVDRAKAQRVDEADLARAKASVLTEQFMGKQTNSDRATEQSLAELYGLGLDDSERFLKQVQELDAATLEVVARTYLRNPVIVILTHEPMTDEQIKALTPAKQP